MWSYAQGKNHGNYNARIDCTTDKKPTKQPTITLISRNACQRECQLPNPMRNININCSYILKSGWVSDLINLIQIFMETSGIEILSNTMVLVVLLKLPIAIEPPTTNTLAWQGCNVTTCGISTISSHPTIDTIFHVSIHYKIITFPISQCRLYNSNIVRRSISSAFWNPFPCLPSMSWPNRLSLSEECDIILTFRKRYWILSFIIFVCDSMWIIVKCINRRNVGLFSIRSSRNLKIIVSYFFDLS